MIFLAVPLLAAPPNDTKDAEDELKKAINASDLDGADRAIAKLRNAGGSAAVKALVGLARQIPGGQEGTYWRLVNGAASFRDDPGLEEVAKTVLDAANPKNAALARDLIFALGNNRAPKVATLVYGPVLEKGTDEFRLMAADNLCGIEFVEAVDVIVQVYKKEEKKKGEVASRLLAGLKWLTGADCGGADAWDAWWKGTGRAAGLKGRARRDENTGTVVDEGGPWVDVQTLEKIKPERIVVLVGDCPKNKRPLTPLGCNYDDMDKLLKDMKIPHTIMKKTELESGKATLDKAMALLITCTQINDHCVCATCVPGGGNSGNRMVHCTGCDKHETANHKLSAASVKKIKEWCERGGYVFSEDWGIKDCLEGAWPTLVKQGKMMKERTVPCSPSRGRTSHPLLRGVFLDPAAKAVEKPAPDGGEAGADGGTVVREAPTMDGIKIQRDWKIDDDSPFIDVVNKSAVTLLMESDVLAKEGSSAVALTFLPAGGSETSATNGKPEKLVGGRVLHVLSHFGKQNNKIDEFALQTLLLNFLMEANRRYHGGKS